MRSWIQAALSGLLLLSLASLAAAGQQVGVRKTAFSANGVWTLPSTGQARRASFDCRGAWGGGTLAALVSVDGANFVPATDGLSPIACSGDCTGQLLSEGNGLVLAVRLSLSGATAPQIACVVLVATEEGK